MLEIGTAEGGTLYRWLADAVPGALVVAVDLQHDRARWRPWLSGLAGVVDLVLITGASGDPSTVHAVAAYAPFDWIYIDADHHEAEVRQDWLLYGRLAAPGGSVVFHDVAPTTDPTVEVDRLWAELVAEPTLDTAEIVEPGGYGIGIVSLASARA